MLTHILKTHIDVYAGNADQDDPILYTHHFAQTIKVPAPLPKGLFLLLGKPGAKESEKEEFEIADIYLDLTMPDKAFGVDLDAAYTAEKDALALVNKYKSIGFVLTSTTDHRDQK